MFLEINLVKTDGVFATTNSLLIRRRVELTEKDTPLTEIKKFINDNFDLIGPAINSLELRNNLSSLKQMTNDEFYTLKYLMSLNGYNILAWLTADGERNAKDIPEDNIEFNVLDHLDTFFGAIPFETKFTYPRDMFTPDKLYSDIMNAYRLFNNGIYKSGSNPIGNDIRVMGEQVKAGIPVSRGLVEHIGSILSLLGKTIVTITK